jgi:hypothetical protein
MGVTSVITVVDHAPIGTGAVQPEAAENVKLVTGMELEPEQSR